MHSEWIQSGQVSTNLTRAATLYNPKTGLEEIYYEGFDGKLWETYFANNIAHTQGIQPAMTAMSSDPATLYNPNGLEEIYYEGSDGNLRETYFANSTPHTQGLPPVMKSDPATLYNPKTGREEIYYRGSNGNLWRTYFANSVAHTQDLQAAMAGSRG
jgi:hypothetical protein